MDRDANCKNGFQQHLIKQKMDKKGTSEQKLDEFNEAAQAINFCW